MYKVNDYVVYKKDVCLVKEIKSNRINDSYYYVLIPIDDDSLKIKVPVDNKMGFIRDIISKKETEKLIEKIPFIDPLANIEDKYIEKTYKDLIYNGKQEDLVKIIKTAYLRNKDRESANRKLSDKDIHYFEQAERYLYNEIAISLGVSFEKAKEYIVDKVSKLVSNK